VPQKGVATMKKLTLFPTGAILLGVLLAWSAFAPATPYTGTLATIGGERIKWTATMPYNWRGTRG
jgi:hypothetical protein